YLVSGWQSSRMRSVCVSHASRITKSASIGVFAFLSPCFLLPFEFVFFDLSPVFSGVIPPFFSSICLNLSRSSRSLWCLSRAAFLPAWERFSASDLALAYNSDNHGLYILPSLTYNNGEWLSIRMARNLRHLA